MILCSKFSVWSELMVKGKHVIKLTHQLSMQSQIHALSPVIDDHTILCCNTNYRVQFIVQLCHTFTDHVTHLSCISSLF